MQTNGTTMTNDTTKPAAPKETKEPKRTRLDEIHEKHVEALKAKGAKGPTKKEVVAAMKAYRDAEKAVEDAEAHVAELRRKQSEVAEQVVLVTGRAPFQLDGQTFIPACREQTIFFKVPGKVNDGRSF